jgi:hypothetical protein
MANGTAWAKLQAHYDAKMHEVQMKDLFASDS